LIFISNKSTDYFIKTLLLTLCLFLSSSFAWFEDYLFNTRYLFLICLLFLTFKLKVHLLEFINYTISKKISADLFLIFIYLLQILIKQQISFEYTSILLLYFFTKFIFFTFQKDKFMMEISRNSLFFFGLIYLVGIYLGIFEIIFLNTDVFYELKPAFYPNYLANFLTKNGPINFSSFSLSYNYTAYILIAFISLVHVVNIPKKILILFFSYVGLFLTGAKIFYLYLSILLVLKVIKNKKLNIFFIVSLIFGYLLMSHFVISDFGNVQTGSKYFYGKIYQNSYIAIYESLFFNLKNIFINLFSSFNISEISLNVFTIESKGLEPHSLMISLFLIGGIQLLLFGLFVIFSTITKLLNEEYLDQKKNFLLSIIFVFAVESIFLWDSYDSLLFWFILIIYPHLHKRTLN